MTLKLFVADDSVTIQKIIGLAFSGEDAVIESVANGDSALDVIRAFRPDIVLADVYMPGCNGYEVCAHIKEDPELTHTPVVLLVGTFEPFDESEASRVKCDGYLTKPFDTSELLQIVHTLIGKAKMTQESNTPASSFMEPEKETSPNDSSFQKSSSSRGEGLVSPRAWASFLGSNRVLEVFDQETLAAAEGKICIQGKAQVVPEKKSAAASMTPTMAPGQLSEEMLNDIVDRVVRRMSAEVIREVAWEVVPELSEVIIRRSLEEKNKS